MQPTYEALFAQNEFLTQQLNVALLEIQSIKLEITQLKAENAALRAENAELKAENGKLKTEIKQLNERLNTNSTNSSTPPSQDPFRKAKKKKKTGCKQGGQPGHNGHQRDLYPLEQVQAVHDLRPTFCPNCESKEFHQEAISTDTRQVIELPDNPPQITQFNIHTCQCTCCGKRVKADVPPEAKYGFGPRLMGFITSLSGEFRLSKRQVVALVGKIGIRMCSGSVCKIHERASRILSTPYEEVKQYTLKQKHLNADETSWRTLSKKRWCWIGRGQNSMFFVITKCRSAEAFKNTFGEFKGGLTTDRYSAYNSHEGLQQLCWSHADRDFEKISSREGTDKWIGENILDCKKNIFDLWHQFKNGLIEREKLIEKIEKGPKEKLRVLLKAGAAHPDCCNKTKATCADFFFRFDMLWLFIYQEGVEPTNNAAEQGLRHGVIWRKLSHGSQSEMGERFTERVMTVAMTLKLWAKNSFEYFTECFKALIYGTSSPPVFSS